ncbi:MAG: hypothetical protein ACREPM_01625 [Gemmatimonadaceae bacterium]
MTRRHVAGLPLLVALLGVAALAIVVLAFAIDMRELAATFLVAYVAMVSVALGTLALVLIAHLTTATWFRPFLPRAYLVLRSLPFLAAIGAIQLIVLPTLYPWVGVGARAHAYLNAPFFVVRWVVYWAAWITISRSVLAAQRLQDAGETARAAHHFRRTASAGLVVLGLTMTFAAFDWMMSLTPDWASTIYGVYWFAGGMLSALALLAMLAHRSDARWPAVSSDDVHSLGKLLTTFVLFWLYIGFAQYIVIWSGDLPSEITWYVARTHGGWGALAGVLLAGNFVFPFLLLLLRAVKRSATLLAMIGAMMLGLHYLDTFWVVMPGLVPVRWWTAIVSASVLALLCIAALMTLGPPREWERAR